MKTCETCRWSREEPDAEDPPPYSCDVVTGEKLLVPSWAAFAVDDWCDDYLVKGGDGRACVEGAPPCPAWEERR